MNCERFREFSADALRGALTVEGQREFDAHLAACSSCGDHYLQARRVWLDMETLPDESPSPQLRARFYQTLAAYQQGLEHSMTYPATVVHRPNAGWLRRPEWQVAMAAGLLLAGFLGGQWLPARHAAPKTEVGKLAELSEEVRTMRQLVTLSLLQQQSASDRLKGVNWSYQLEQGDTQVPSALLYTLNQDSNVNVRLAAVDALYKFADSEMVRRGLRRSLIEQDSPLVQIALIDVLTDIRDRQAKEVLEQLARNSKVNQDVKSRAQRSLKQLAGAAAMVPKSTVQ